MCYRPIRPRRLDRSFYIPGPVLSARTDIAVTTNKAIEIKDEMANFRIATPPTGNEPAGGLAVGPI